MSVQVDPLLKKVKPVKDSSDVDRKLFPPPQPGILPVHPFRLLIAGQGASGKTTLLISLLTKPDFYKNYFQRFIIISPNIHAQQWEKALERLGDKATTFDEWDSETQAACNEILQTQKQSIETDGRLLTPKILWVFDDMVDNTRFVNSTFLKMLFVRGRHLNCSSLFCVQYFNGFPLKLRKQLTNVIAFGTANGKEVQALAQEFCHRKLTHDQFVQLFNNVTRERFSFMHINLQCSDPDECIRKGFCEVLRVK